MKLTIVDTNCWSFLKEHHHYHLPLARRRQFKVSLSPFRMMSFVFADVGFAEASVAPPNQVVIDVQELLKQAGKPMDILEEYVEDAVLTGLF